ncbi:MAG: DnaJ C-terminal domain-containing protein [Phycisphaerales bacterium]|jgi:DnaJ-class molecular chaperone|nr:DnaJ C-terminal domain-containing protein [Phycisphaerales bacterium]
MASTTDYYETLGVDRSATAEEIRKAYRRLARKYHPDVNKEADAATKFAEVQEAYDILSDAEKRKSYDRFGAAGPGDGMGGDGFRGPYSWSQQGGSDVDFSEVFGSMFGGGRSPFEGGHAHAPPQAGRDVAEKITVTFMTALHGGVEEVHLADGSRAKVRIPAGFEPGRRLRLKGKGESGMSGGPAGDVLLTVDVGGHPWLRRSGLDIEMDVPINAAEAALGTSVTLPLPLGGTVDLVVPSGVSSGQRLRVKGQGAKRPDGTSGDFYAIVQIVTPPLDDESTELMEQLKEHLGDVRSDCPWRAEVDG